MKCNRVLSTKTGQDFAYVTNCWFHWKNFEILIFMLKSLNVGIYLELPLWCSSKGYPQSMFSVRNKENCIPMCTLVSLYKSMV